MDIEIEVFGQVLPLTLKGPQELLAARKEVLPQGDLFVVFNLEAMQVYCRLPRETLDQSFPKTKADWIQTNGWDIGCITKVSEVKKSADGGFALINEVFPVRDGPRV